MEIDLNYTNYKNLILSVESKIEDAILNLNNSGMRIVLVVDINNKLMGTITDGDIRRGLLQGCVLSDNVMKITNLNPIKVIEKISRSDILMLMEKSGHGQIPCVDINDNLLGLFIEKSKKELKYLEHTLVIMAGGKGTRLHPVTVNLPKPLIQINEKPILQHIIEMALDQGIKHFVLVINYLGNLIQEYFGDGSRFGAKIEYVVENKPLGTAGGLSKIVIKNDNPLIVINGDILTSINFRDLIDFHNKQQGVATMAVRQHIIENPFGVIESEDFQLKQYIEKPVYKSIINAGIYVLDHHVLELIKDETYIDMPELFQIALDYGMKISIFPLHENWIDIGNPSDLGKVIAGMTK